MIKSMQDLPGHTLWLRNNHYEANLDKVVKELEKWKSGHYKDLEQHTFYKKCYLSNQII